MNRYWWWICCGGIVVGERVELKVGSSYVTHVRWHYTAGSDAIACYCRVKDIQSWQFDNVFFEDDGKWIRLWNRLFKLLTHVVIALDDSNMLALPMWSILGSKRQNAIQILRICNPSIASFASIDSSVFMPRTCWRPSP